MTIQSKNNKTSAKLLQGGDAFGQVFDMGEYILRTESPEKKGVATKFYDLYTSYTLLDLGLVETELLPTSPPSLKHKKMRISYPHEWAPNMLKDALLFHIHLWIKLDEYGLVLKDALPENILFSGTNPSFVDVYSVIPIDELPKELACENMQDAQTTLLKNMFLPFCLLPTISYAYKLYEIGEFSLKNLFCNNEQQKVLTWEHFPPHTIKKTEQIHITKLIEGFPGMPWKRRLSQLAEIIKTYCVSPKNSDYGAYYAAKGEDFSFKHDESWEDKQKSVYACLQQCRPETVLDLGANTGWFSCMAAAQGFSVIATDIDLYCVDKIYETAKSHNLDILPLHLSYDDLFAESYAMVDRKRSLIPFHTRALERIASDMVFCLGLVHHLTLGLGYSMASVIETLAKLAHKQLVLEFVEYHDPKIIESPDFFGSLHKFSPETYTLDMVQQELRTHFSTIEILPSEPTRHILLCIK